MRVWRLLAGTLLLPSLLSATELPANPYQQQISELQSQLRQARPASQQAALLPRIVALRDRSDRPMDVDAFLGLLVADSSFDAALRERAKVYLSGSDRRLPFDSELLAVARAAVEAAQREHSAVEVEALALEALGRLEQDARLANGLEHLQRAARLAPTVDRWLAAADACADSSCRYAALSAALATDANNAAAHRALAEYYFARGQLQKSRDLLRSALRVAPDDFVARKLLADVYSAAGAHSAAEGEYSRLQRDFPALPWVQRALAARYQSWGQLAQAEALLRKAMSAGLDAAEERAMLAAIVRQRGDPAAAALSPGQETLRQDAAEASTSAAEAEYLADAGDLASAAQSKPPAAGADAVSLADIRVQRVLPNGLSTTHVQQLFFIATTAGARTFSSRTIQYSPSTQQLTILRARVHRADGSLLEGGSDGESELGGSGATMYYDVRLRQVRFPPLSPGDVVELDYRLTPNVQSNPYGDSFGELVVFGSEFPQQLTRYALITPAARRFSVSEARLAPAQVRLRGAERTYLWETRQQPPVASEPRSPAQIETAPYVHASTFQSWQEAGLWYAQLISPQFALDDDLRKALASVLAGRRSEAEKIRAIHEFVLRSTHYVALEFGIHSYKPYPASQVYARRFGDCKDKAALMIALLRAAGIDAEMALVRTRRMGEIDGSTASIAVFNHAVAYLPAQDLWLDGTAEYAGARELPEEDQGAMALTVAADGRSALRRIPVSAAADNLTRRDINVQISGGGSMRFAGATYTRGEDAPGLRRSYEASAGRLDLFRNRMAEVVPGIRVDAVEVDGAGDLGRDVTLRFRGALESFRGQRTITMPVSWISANYVQRLAPMGARKQDLLLPLPWTTEEEVRFELPAGARVAPPAALKLQARFGTASMRFEHRGRTLVISTRVRFTQQRIAPHDYAAFREFCSQLDYALRQELRVRIGG